jgi:hypothetical protein
MLLISGTACGVPGHIMLLALSSIMKHRALSGALITAEEFKAKKRERLDRM